MTVERMLSNEDRVSSDGGIIFKGDEVWFVHNSRMCSYLSKERYMELYGLSESDIDPCPSIKRVESRGSRWGIILND